MYDKYTASSIKYTKYLIKSQKAALMMHGMLGDAVLSACINRINANVE